MNIIQKIEEEALIFMHNRKKIEDRLSKDMLKIVDNMQKDIYRTIRAQESLSISALSLFIDNEIRPIIEQYRTEQDNLMDSAIRREYEVGIENGQRLMSLSNDSNIPPLDNELNNSYYEEVLIALLLFGNRLILSLGEDMSNNLLKDMTSIYISSKNLANQEIQREIDSNNDSTLSTVIKGTIIGKYISRTFRNIYNRADMIARNESNRALNHGHMMRYLRADMQYVKWVVVEDEKLCHKCRTAGHGGSIGNGVYLLDEITPPPLHSRCRCILAPFKDIWEEKMY